MVKLASQDIQSKEVLQYEGLHLFHFPMSSCSQKVRIFLNLKGIEWQPHIVDLLANENLSPRFLGINPRGLVPVLIDNGDVHIESNDIMLHLEDKYPSPSLMPEDRREEMESMLRFEDDLHMDLRTLSFRFLFVPDKPPKTSDDLDRYAHTGSGTVLGTRDEHKEREIAYWESYAREGISDEMACAAAGRFRTALDAVESRLAHAPFLCGDTLSLVDIAWVVYCNRLSLSGYPMRRLHSRLATWYGDLAKRQEFASELALPPPMATRLESAPDSFRKALEKTCFACN